MHVCIYMNPQCVYTAANGGGSATECGLPLISCRRCNLPRGWPSRIASATLTCHNYAAPVSHRWFRRRAAFAETAVIRRRSPTEVRERFNKQLRATAVAAQLVTACNKSKQSAGTRAEKSSEISHLRSNIHYLWLFQSRERPWSRSAARSFETTLE